MDTLSHNKYYSESITHHICRKKGIAWNTDNLETLNSNQVAENTMLHNLQFNFILTSSSCAIREFQNTQSAQLMDY